MWRSENLLQNLESDRGTSYKLWQRPARPQKKKRHTPRKTGQTCNKMKLPNILAAVLKSPRLAAARLAANNGGTSNTIPDWWSDLHQKIKKSNTYCYLRSRNAGPSIIDAYSSTEIYKNRNPNLEPSKIKFGEDKYNSGKYNYFKSPSGNMLLVPPLDIGATDIKDFAERYGIDEWNTLYKEIKERWRSGIWVDTEGHAVKYLHIRFEQTPLYNPSSDHTRL